MLSVWLEFLQTKLNWSNLKLFLRVPRRHYQISSLILLFLMLYYIFYLLIYLYFEDYRPWISWNLRISYSQRLCKNIYRCKEIRMKRQKHRRECLTFDTWLYHDVSALIVNLSFSLFRLLFLTFFACSWEYSYTTSENNFRERAFF